MTTFLRNYFRQPQKLFLRKAIFQIHLWVGLLATLYVALIGLSGAILVFRPELQRMTHQLPASQVTPVDLRIGPSKAIAVAQASLPDKRPYFLNFPTPKNPYYAVYFFGKQRGTALVSPTDGSILRLERAETGWLSVIANFHYSLLLPRNVGLLWNGIGAASLLLIALSGLVLWWPGIRAWKRAFWVDLRLSFKRVTRDSHNVIGFYALALISFWSITGIYFAWPKQFTAAVNSVFHVSASRERQQPSAATGKPLSADALVLSAKQADPQKVPLFLRLAGGRGGSVAYVYLGRDVDTTYAQSDVVSVNAVTGSVLRVDSPDAPKSFGDKIIALMVPLHFGTQWGLGVKLLYCLAGLAVPFLAATGVMMYWHRFLQKRWARLRDKSRVRKQLQQTSPLLQVSSE